MHATTKEKLEARLRQELEEFSERVLKHSKAPSEVNLRLADSEEHYLDKINSALERIEDGTYGKCVSCGNAIPLPRLEAKPAASLCLDCQESKEHSVDPLESGESDW